ncbi:hypothetical protein DSL72_003961 [Monilinia vaccinii-corymbosi]|uniref:Rad60/SUMO-like domain-containing protein n=1 Tax=Monilinia vaccinii-corymbosi TaxID=61207 RepID=A0A8A3P9H7_9HELO|nr:hypothetical protein DSL72_003961 [Monilinia vaccinii-corymbosi]
MKSPTLDPKTPSRENGPEHGTGNDTGNGTPNDNPKPTNIAITVTDQAGTSITFKIKRARPLAKIIEAYCRNMGIHDPTSVRFFYDGIRIQQEDTADSLEMCVDGRIDVHVFQEGGGD